MTKHPIKLNTPVIPKTLYSDTNTNQEQTDNSPTSSPSPSPPSSSPHSPVEATAAQPSSPPSSPEFPEINLLCQRLKPSIEELYKKTLNSADFMIILAKELTPIIHKHLGPKKTTKKKRDRGSTRKCSICGTVSTPEWRRDPEGLLTLCNACGLKEKKNRGKKSNNAAASPSYSAQRFHNTVWSQQYPASSASGGPPAPPSRHPQVPPAQLALPAPAPIPPPHGMSQHQNIPPMYQPFPKPPPQAFKIEDNNGVQFNQRYLQSQMVHQPNNMPPTYNQNYQFPVHFNEDVFGYHHHQSMPNAYPYQCDRPNCPQCLQFYSY